jgi:hypothetical protein
VLKNAPERVFQHSLLKKNQLPSAPHAGQKLDRRMPCGTIVAMRKIPPCLFLFAVFTASSVALGEEQKDSTIQITPAAKAAPEPKLEPFRPEAVGAIAAPAALDLDEGPVSDQRKTLTWIGFHQAPAYSRLFMKTTQRVAFDVAPGSGVIRVTLKNTRARLRNNLRYLDTSFFPAAVWKVVPRRGPAGVVVEIQMREAVPYRVRRRGDEIQIDFDLPAKK